MHGKTSRKIMIFRRIAKLREEVKLDTQQIRQKTLASLEEIFDLAVSLAKGTVKTQNEKGKPAKVTIKQRQIWARVAAYTAQIMNSIASGFDEKEVDVQLDELEKLVNEAKAKAKDGGAQKGPAETREDTVAG